MRENGVGGEVILDNAHKAPQGGDNQADTGTRWRRGELGTRGRNVRGMFQEHQGDQCGWNKASRTVAGDEFSKVARGEIIWVVLGPERP